MCYSGSEPSPVDHPAADVYVALIDHQLHEDWEGRDIVKWLQPWAKRFDVEFKLDVPEIALCVEDLPVSTLCRFRPGHNGFGLKGEVTLNRRHLAGKSGEWMVLGALLKGLLHAWQESHGTSGTKFHHNRVFRDKAAELGLLVNKRGLWGTPPMVPSRRFCGGSVLPYPKSACRFRRIAPGAIRS